ncbi:MAG TPA: sigma 54-interacting transcriptional regulator, partial [Kofleriaceae bacterium]|nr:sigma 54-interacting transcriptional regulator [Kofleriaceae bacterium]
AVSIEDCGSRNGTTVNGMPITGSRRLTAGDVIGVGPATAIVATSSATRRTRQIATIGELEDRLEAEVDRAIRYHRPLGVVMVRLEGATDLVMSHVEKLSGHLRRMDLIAEYGSDEIALVLPEADPAAVFVVAQRCASPDPGLLARVGSATFPEDGSNSGQLIGCARERLRGARANAPIAKNTDSMPILGTDVVVIDPLMKQVFKLAKRAATAAISVLVVGETGTGKEVVSETIHRLSPRAAGPYVKLNCAALSETLVESELFGHDKGAFTGAIATKAGFFESANGGTLFLDEIGELPLGTQAKLLRVLEQHKITHVGGTKEIPIDVRLICATNRDLEAEVHRGRFREDLYFRIAAFVIPVPPLRDRKTEILPLAVRFTGEIASQLGHPPIGFSPEALDALQEYDWPGNVRELRNTIERAVVLSSGAGKIERHHLPERMHERATQPADALDVRQRVAAVERDTILAALDATGGNQTQAAKKLGISRFALIRLMDKHDLKRQR